MRPKIYTQDEIDNGVPEGTPVIEVLESIREQIQLSAFDIGTDVKPLAEHLTGIKKQIADIQSIDLTPVIRAIPKMPDVSALAVIRTILDDILISVKENKPIDTSKNIVATLTKLGEHKERSLDEATIKSIADSFEKAAKKINFNVYGGRGGSNGAVKNVSGTVINPATEDKQDTTNTALSKLVGFEIPAHDYISLSYVASGDGVGEIETVTYKTGGAGGTTVATLTLTYNTANEIATITKT